jgi:hypothetical protein
LALQIGTKMKTQIIFHIIFVFGFLNLFLISSFIQLIDHRTSIYLILAGMAYTILLCWSIFVLFTCHRNSLIVIEAILGFLLGAFMVPALGRSWEYIFRQKTEYDIIQFSNSIFILYLHITNLMVLFCPFLCKWRKSWRKKSSGDNQAL